MTFTAIINVVIKVQLLKNVITHLTTATIKIIFIVFIPFMAGAGTAFNAPPPFAI